MNPSTTKQTHAASVANGLDSPGLVKLLKGAPISRFDVVVLSMGAIDMTCLCPPQRWVQWQTQLAELISHRFAPHLLVHSAVPPTHQCLALPQLLRWFLGRWALEMNLLLSDLLNGQQKRTMHWHPEATTSWLLKPSTLHAMSVNRFDSGCPAPTNDFDL
jgi:hypothetical protein